MECGGRHLAQMAINVAGTIYHGEYSGRAFLPGQPTTTTGTNTTATTTTTPTRTQWFWTMTTAMTDDSVSREDKLLLLLLCVCVFVKIIASSAVVAGLKFNCKS